MMSVETESPPKDIVEMGILNDEMELGAEVEDGEICDEDDEVKEDASSSNIVESESNVSNTHNSRVITQRKPRDFDREEIASARVMETTMINSWVNGVKQRTKPTSSDSLSQSIDANEEYYGYGSPNHSSADKDYRNSRGNDSNDKDYRWGTARDDENHRSTDATNEFGDSDYRSSSPRPDRRRRRSPSPYGGKRGRLHSPPSRAYRNFRGHRRFERQICKFFREGYCRDGDNCAYSHDASDSGRKPELCKFYQQGHCKKGLQCPLLHGEYPCKAHHKGECSRDRCPYSHQPLTAFTKPIFEQMMKDDEIAAKIAIPQGPNKRRVLLPGGPSASSPSSTVMSNVITVGTGVDQILGGVIPPPSVVLPTLSVGTTQSQLLIQTPYPAFFTHHAESSTSGLGSDGKGAIAQQKSTDLLGERDASKEDDDDGSTFNIKKILEQLQTGIISNITEESPASPVEDMSNVVVDEARVIPHTSLPDWKLIEMIDMPLPSSAVTHEIIQISLSNSRLQNDPRIKRVASKHFDSFTDSLKKFQTPLSSSSTFSSGITSQQPVSSVDEQKSVVRLSDPRTVANRDPRRRSIVSDPRTANSSIQKERASASVDERLPSQTVSSTTYNLYEPIFPLRASERMSDLDQRDQSLSNIFEEKVDDTQKPMISGGWMPQLGDAEAKSSQRNRDNVYGTYRNFYGVFDRDERGSSGELSIVSPVSNEGAVTSSPTETMSLRERRRNNEYESPLSRLPGNSRWGQ